MWKPVIINNITTNYLINENGEILNKTTKKLLAKSSKMEGGYLRVSLCINGKTVSKLVHVLVAEAFVNKPKVEDDVKLEVNHLNGKKDDPRASNLQWVTRSQNIVHAIANGLMVPKNGINHGRCNTDEETVRKVCKLLEDGKHPREISELLEVPESLPSAIKHFNAWRHISKDYNIPRSGEIPKGPRRHPEVSKIYPPTIIHKTCELLEAGFGDSEISKLLGVKLGFASDIKRRRIWNYYSDQYNIPYPKNLSRHDYYFERVTGLIAKGHTSTKMILLRLGIPETEDNINFINDIYKEIIQQSSTTIM